MMMNNVEDCRHSFVYLLLYVIIVLENNDAFVACGRWN